MDTELSFIAKSLRSKIKTNTDQRVTDADRHMISSCFNFYVLSFQRLQAKIIKIVDVSYGGENGFNQAIELSADALSNVKFIQEKKLIGKIFLEWHNRAFALTTI